MALRRFILATRNIDKAGEIRQILNRPSWDLLSLEGFPEIPEVEETGTTFLENALLKARTVFRETGIISIADDSGLEVDALNGAPGVRSSRFADAKGDYQKNNEKLLQLLSGISVEERTAHFRCVVALVDGKNEHWVEGICEGEILDAYRGNQGFGYDPVFFMPRLGKTFAQMTREEKNVVSHRGIAFRKMARLMQDLYSAEE